MSRVAVYNAVQRTLSSLFPAYFPGSTKHDHYVDFGWPRDLKFEQFYHMWKRNSIAKAGINKTVAKTWETTPELWETEKSGKTPLEKLIAAHLRDRRVWRAMFEADRRSMVGGYAALILRVNDGRDWHEPVGAVSGGIQALEGVISVWSSQLKEGDLDVNPRSPTYGQPLNYEFNESSLPGKRTTKAVGRAIKIHPDRVIIWSEDGTIDCESALEAGYNDLLDIEKIKGAGGEGFWKNSRGAPIIQAPEGTKQSDVSKAMGVTNEELLDALNEQIESFQQGFDKGLMLGGMTAQPMSITLPNPEQFFVAPAQSFAASLSIPLKVLMGSQTGERSSTEDAKEWNRTIMGRRTSQTIPLIRTFIDRLVLFRMVPVVEWFIQWPSLTEATAEEKMKQAEQMSTINSKMPNQPAFSWEEIREAGGYDPDTEFEKPDLIDPSDKEIEDEDTE